MVATTVTAGGYYLFTNVPPANYVVDVTDTSNVLAGYTLTAGPESNPDPTAAFAVAAGDVVLTKDFGYNNPALYTITDVVWYDANRDGFVISGGGAIVTLEDYESARRRGARIYGEILGYAATSDGFDMVLPEPAGRQPLLVELRRPGPSYMVDTLSSLRALRSGRTSQAGRPLCALRPGGAGQTRCALRTLGSGRSSIESLVIVHEKSPHIALDPGGPGRGRWK